MKMYPISEEYFIFKGVCVGGGGCMTSSGVMSWERYLSVVVVVRCWSANFKVPLPWQKNNRYGLYYFTPILRLGTHQGC